MTTRPIRITDSISFGGDNPPLFIAGPCVIESREHALRMAGVLARLRDELKITIILVAHDIPLVMNLCERIQVLNYGKLIAEGDPAAVRNNPEVIAAYGGSAEEMVRRRDEQ